MFNVTRSARGTKKLTAMLFAFSVVAVVFIGFVVATESSATYHIFLYPNYPKSLSIDGSFLTVSIDVSSREPVTLCITDSTGLERLKTGGKALCYFYVSNVKNAKKIWRSPKGGKFYLIILSDKETEATITIKSGFLVK
ncbi:hypothetical protein [Thermococcus sp.]|uniref:hypothetical protein n=1 Tax=Thermococcus sp. TaxID=35749 RepID=UPI0026049C0A|nr:hypothetical protein [Thermococcus sp.]